MSPLCCTQYCKERNLKMHHWLIKDTKNQVTNTVSSCRYEHQEMGQISGGKRGSLALTVSGCTVCTLWFIYFWFRKYLLISKAVHRRWGQCRRHRHFGISVRFRSILVSDWLPLFQYRTVSPSAFLFRFRPDRIPDCPAFKKLYEGGKKINLTVQIFFFFFFFFLIVFVLGGSPTPHPISSRPHFCM